MRLGPYLVLVILIALLMLSGGAAAQTETLTETLTAEGYCDNPDDDPSGAVSTVEYDLEVREVFSVDVSLRWTDDQAGSDPDAFHLTVSDQGGISSSDAGTGGSLSATLEEEGMGLNWTITIECVDAGWTPLGPFGRFGTPDPGNSWEITFTYTYVEVEPPGPPGPPPEIQELYENPIFWTHVIFMIASTYMFGIAGILAGIALFFGSRWRDDPNRWKRALTKNRPFRALAVHTWLVFFIAAVPLGMYVAGKAYGWENMWTSFPVVWNDWFWQWENADHVSLIVLLLWALPLWFNRSQLMTPRSHVWLFGRIGWFRKLAANAPKPKLTNREMAIMYFLMGVFVFLVFMVQEHGN
jgi:hypothetical protein